jgi:hypothetical protein
LIPSLETEGMWARPRRLEDAEQVVFPQWEIVKHLGAVVPWLYRPDGALQFYRDVAIPQIERAEPIETNRGFWMRFVRFLRIYFQ